MLDYEPVSRHPRRHLFQASGAPALPGRSSEVKQSEIDYPVVTLVFSFVSGKPSKPAGPVQIKPSMGRPLSPPMELAILTGRWMGVMYSLVQSIPSAL